MKTKLTLLALLLIPLSALHAADAPMQKPNVIVILADDLGYECIGADGGKSYQTPDSKDYGQPGANAKAANQQHFADMVAYMDKQVGGLTKELESLGLRDNTLILFTGDNGTGRGATSTLEDGSEQDGEKGSTTRGGELQTCRARPPLRTHSRRRWSNSKTPAPPA